MLLGQKHPGFDQYLKIGLGLMMLLLGLNTLFRLAAFGPAPTTRNRVRDSLGGCAMVLIGVGQLAGNRYVTFGLAVIGLVCAVATATGRPRRLLARGLNSR